MDAHVEVFAEGCWHQGLLLEHEQVREGGRWRFHVAYVRVDVAAMGVALFEDWCEQEHVRRRRGVERGSGS